MSRSNHTFQPDDDISLASHEIKLRRQLEDCAHIGAIEWDLESGLFWWSDFLKTLFGLGETSPSATLQNLINCIHPNEQQKVQAIFEQTMQEGGRHRIHTRALAINGNEIPILLVLQLPQHASRLTGYIQDDREDSNERAHLTETLAKYRSVMNGVADAILLFSGDGKIIEGNPKASEMLEVKEKQLANLNIDEIHPKVQLERMMEHYQSFLWGHPERIQSVVKGKEGRTTYVEISGQAIKIGSQEILIAVYRDITEQKQAQEALVRSENRYRRLVDEAREGILLLDQDGKILATNPKICESTGYKRSDLLECNFNDIADFEMEILATELLKELRTRPSMHIEGALLTLSGTYVPTGFNIARFIEQGKTHFIVTAYDLTNVRKGEEDRLKLQKQLFQAQKQELMGQLAGSLAHDFNNLLSPILLVSETLMEDTEDPFYKENLSKVNQAAQRARRLVHRILTYTRPEESEPYKIDLRHELEEALVLLRSSIPQTILLEENIDPSDFPCFADPDQIHQVIMNIGTNAAQAIGAKNGTINISLEKITINETSELIDQLELPEGLYGLLKIKDTGPGIPENIIDRIFDPFFTTKTQTDGSGLGLSVVMQIISNHGGAAKAHCEADQGAEVCVYLPLE